MKLRAELALALFLTLLAGAAPAASMCAIDPVSHRVTVLQGEGNGGIGGTGAPREKKAAVTLSVQDGIGGTGAPAERMAAVSAVHNAGGIGGSGAPAKPVPGQVVAAGGIGGIGGTGAPIEVAYAGRVLFAHGTVAAGRSDGGRRVLRQGEPVCEGDAIDTKAASVVQLAMADGGRLDLRAQSSLHIDRFTLPDRMDGSERFSATLAWGSVHAVTGEIGHVHKALYALHTPLADIGVRGTSHEVFHVPQARPGVPAGTYDRVLSGGTVLQGGGGSLDLAPAQAGFVPLGGGKPRLLEHLPAALTQQNSLAMSDAWRSLLKGDRVDDEGPAVYLKPLDTITQYVDMSAQAPTGSAYVGASQDLGAGEVRVGGVASFRRNRSVIVLDPRWGLPSAAADTNNGFNFFTADVTELFDYGAAKVDGVDVIWGLYGDGNDVDPVSGAIRNVDFHHFVFAPRGITPRAVLSGLSGSATFGNLVGGTMLSDESGALGGQINGLKVGVLFGPQVKVTSYQLNVTDAQARTWDAQFNGAIDLHSFRAGNLPLDVQCSGCASGSGTGNAAGVIVGNSGKGIITSYGLRANSGEKVSGAAVVSRP